MTGIIRKLLRGAGNIIKKIAFSSGYMLTAFSVGTFYHTKAVLVSLKNDNTQANVDNIAELLSLSDKSYGCFLNQCKDVYSSMCSWWETGACKVWDW